MVPHITVRTTLQQLELTAAQTARFFSCCSEDIRTASVTAVGDVWCLVIDREWVWVFVLMWDLVWNQCWELFLFDWILLCVSGPSSSWLEGRMDAARSNTTVMRSRLCECSCVFWEIAQNSFVLKGFWNKSCMWKTFFFFTKRALVLLQQNVDWKVWEKNVILCYTHLNKSPEAIMK